MAGNRISGGYPHKIAISNHRLDNMDHRMVIFRYKDYWHGASFSLSNKHHLL
ncbi:MAG: transposase [Williamsia sp.]|nr:transposase [Williamsia sp.]